MNDLDIFLSARPRVEQLDESASDELRKRLFGSVSAAHPTRTPRRKPVLVGVLGFTAAAALALFVMVGDDTRTISPATDPTVVATNERPPSTPPAASTPPSTLEDPVEPAAQFAPTSEWQQLFEQAREAFIGKCMAAAGFEYTGSPFESENDVQEATIEAGSYAAAYFGIGTNKGCLDEAYGSIFGPVRADVHASDVRGWASAEWYNLALDDPVVEGLLAELAECARHHGVIVRDVVATPSKALDDIERGFAAQTSGDPRLLEIQRLAADGTYVYSLAEQGAVIKTIRAEWCSTFPIFYDRLTLQSDNAAREWIEANPQTMAEIDAEFEEDVARFRFIIANDGDLPPG